MCIFPYATLYDCRRPISIQQDGERQFLINVLLAGFGLLTVNLTLNEPITQELLND